MKIKIIRHGKTKGNLLRQYIGITNEPLCKEGIDEATLYKSLFTPVQKVFVSPLIRCIETAKIIYKDTSIQCIEGLKECNFGDFECKSYNDLKDNINYQKWIDGDSTCHSGESILSFKNRCISSFDEIVENCVEEDLTNIAIVCHGGTIMAILDFISYPNKSFYNWQTDNINGFEFEYSINENKAKNIKAIRGK